MKKTLLIVFVLLIIILPNGAFAESEVYKVAGDIQFPPYEYIDSNGAYKGFNIDILKAISLVTGMEFEFIPMKWEDTYRSIDRGQADIIQGMKESEKRKSKFLFSDSLLINSQSIFVLNNNKNIKNEKDLKNKVIAINKDDSVYDEISKIDNVKIVLYDSLEVGMENLLKNEVDAMVGNTLTVNYLSKENNSIERIKIIGDTLNEQKYSIAVDKNNRELLEKLNEGIYEIQEKGIYDSLYRKWFGNPIRNTKAQYDIWFKYIIIIFIVLLYLIIIKQSVNNKLKKIIEEKIEEQKILLNELSNYDKLQFMNKMISSIAHEIRNPMTSIKIYTSQMKDKMDNREFMLAAAEDIPEEIDRIDELIKGFMEYISPRKPIIVSFNLYEELKNAIKFIKYELEDIEFIIDVDKKHYIRFDMAQFKQIIMNVLLNSRDALIGEEKPFIEISVEEAGENIVLYFRDNGCGMNREKLEYIFDPFYTTKDFGNGVGMFIVKQIVDENEGRISAKSKGKSKGMEISIVIKKGDPNEE